MRGAVWIVAGRVSEVIEEQRKDLIALKNSNYEKETIESAKIEAEAEIERAKGQAKSVLISQEKLTSSEVERVKSLIGLLNKESSSYLKTIELEAFSLFIAEQMVPIVYGIVHALFINSLINLFAAVVLARTKADTR